MAAFDVLATLIGQAPEQLRPVLNQLARIVQDGRGELTQHVGENVTEFASMTTAITQLADRVQNVENAVTSINSTLVTMSARIDTMSQTLGTSS